ncbi:hypothetical protein ES703_111912 [subsurface metagenome]
MEKHLISYLLLIVNLRSLNSFFNKGVDIFTIPFELKKPGLVIYPGTKIGNLFHRSTYPFGQHFSCALDAVAKTGYFDFALTLHGTTKHSHRVCIIEENSLGAVTLYVFTNVKHYWYCSEGPENSSRAPGIANIYIHSILFGDFYI